jgi:uncharacterized SAM-binding protein YcdF (DUF218 family)
MFSCLFAFGLVSLAWPLAAIALVRAGRGRPPPSARFDAIVVLGARVRPDGSASLALDRRVRLGCALLAEGLAPKLVITGGRVGGPVSEAEAARALIERERLAPLDRVVIEPEATTTRTNATRTRALLGDADVLVVSDDWHLPRARRLFARHFRRVETASAPGKMRGALREVAVWLVEWTRR